MWGDSVAKILIVEDELSILKLIEYDLSNAGHECTTCTNGIDALRFFDESSYDIILLDYMLPGKNGVEICKYIREKDKSVYVILITAVTDEASKLKAFEVGADDYIIKPFSIKEVLARIENAYKRISVKSDVLTFLHITLDDSQRSVTCHGASLVLTKTEYELLKYLLTNKDKVVSREKILEHVWGYDYIGETRTVDVYAHKLRDKLDLNKHLKTVRGVGYILRSNLWVQG